MSTLASSSKKQANSKKTVTAPPPPASDSGSASDSEVDSDDIDGSRQTTPKPAQKPRKGSSLSSYQPPPGMEPLTPTLAFTGSPFEFDALARKPGVELWAIRIPADLKPARLAGMTISKVSSKSVSGALATKSGASYALEVAASSVGGDGGEMVDLNLVVPRMSQDGKLFRAPVPIARRLLLTPREGETSRDEHFVAPPKPKREQPAGLLKFRNRAFGFDTPGPEVTTVAGSDRGDESEGEGEGAREVLAEEEATPREEKPEVTPKKSKDKDGKRKKRKSDVADASSPAKKKKKTKD